MGQHEHAATANGHEQGEKINAPQGMGVRQKQYKLFYIQQYTFIV